MNDKCFLCLASGYPGFVRVIHRMPVCEDHSYGWLRKIDLAVQKAADEYKHEYN